MAYILGYFCADGAMTISKRGAKYIDFVSIDLILIKNIRDAFHATHRITVRKIDPTHPHSCYRLQIGSKQIFNDLLKLGITPKKTFRLQLPQIPLKYISDFVRGYFDGDGNVWTGMTHKHRIHPTQALRIVFTSGNQQFLQNLSKLLSNILHISGAISYHSGAYRLSYSTAASLSLHRFMYYNDVRLYLERKKMIFERFAHARQIAVVAQPG